MHTLRIVILTLLSLAALAVSAQERDTILVMGADTIRYRYTPQTMPPHTEASSSVDSAPAKESKRGLRGLYNYFAQSAVDKSFDKKIDLTFAGAPIYSSTTSIGLGLFAGGHYRIDRQNRDLPPSSVSLVVLASITGYYKIKVSGINIFKDDRHRILYNAGFQSQPTKFWGLGHYAATHNTPKVYIANRYIADMRYLHRVCTHAYIGTQIDFDYTYCGKRRPAPSAERLNGQRSHYCATGISLLIEYDSRDVITNAHSGAYLSLQGRMRPEILGSIGENCYSAKVIANYYQKLWKGAVLAFDLYGEYNSEGTPWTLYAQMEGTYRMRGYYDGRFSDLNMVSAQMELRQRIWKRFGMAVWGGAGNVFPNFRGFDWDHTMPNCGVGLRFEFKKRMNIRLDYGFGGVVQGKLINGFLASIHEAF